MGDLVGRQAGVSSCHEGVDANGHVMSWRDCVNLDLESKGSGQVDWGRVDLGFVDLGRVDLG